MADSKISQLTAVSSVTGTEEVPCVQSGSTKKATWAQALSYVTTALNAVFQPLHAFLTALSGLAANGIVCRTGSGTVAVRTIGATANQIVVTYGDGVSGNPALALANKIEVPGTSSGGFSAFIMSGGWDVEGWTGSNLVYGGFRSSQWTIIRWYTNGVDRGRVDATGNWVFSMAALATSATDGFMYLPSCAGAPTGVPTSYTGVVPMVIDTTNSKLYLRIGGTWKSVTLA